MNKEFRISGCRITNKLTGIVEKYTGAKYTKLNGMCGYLCVDGYDVKFFWSHNEEVYCDILNDYTVEYF